MSAKMCSSLSFGSSTSIDYHWRIQNLTTNRKTLTFRVYSSVCIICIFAHIFNAQYFNRPNIGGLFFITNDAPSTITDWEIRFSPIIGGHYFGDLIDGHANLGAQASYFGLSFIFFWLTKDFSYEMFFAIFMVLGAISCALSIRQWLRIVANDQKKMVFALHFSYPFIFAADRGQMHLLIGYLFALGLSYVVNAQSDGKILARGQWALGAAFSIKLYPSILFAFLPRFWSLVKWKFLIVSLLGFLLVTALLKPSGFSSFFVGVDSANPFSSSDYFVLTLQYNTSLKALIYNLDFIMPGKSNFKDYFLIENQLLFYLFYLLYFIAATFLIQNKNFRLHEKILAGAILSISISPIAGIYCQTIVASCALCSLIQYHNISNFRRRFYLLVVMVSIVPFNLSLFPWVDTRYLHFQSTVVPLVQHAFVISMCWISLAQFFSSKSFKKFKLAE